MLAGAGGYDTRETIELARDMAKAGADGLLSVTPYYNKPTQEGLYQHFKAIAQSTPLPIVLYNVPSRTAINMDVATTVAALARFRNIVGIKKRRATSSQMSELVVGDPRGLPGAERRRSRGRGGHGGRRRRRRLGGLERGARGDGADRRDVREGRLRRRARKLHHWLLPLIQVNFVESNPIPCKAAMAAMGLIDEVYRLPLVSPEPSAREKVMAVLQQLRLLGAAARASS